MVFIRHCVAQLLRDIQLTPQPNKVTGVQAVPVQCLRHAHRGAHGVLLFGGQQWRQA